MTVSKEHAKVPKKHVQEAVSFLKKHKNVGNNSDFGTSTASKNARYGVVFKTGVCKELGWYPCHVHMNSGKDASVSFSQIMRTTLPGYSEETEAYFSWILGKDSPWKECLPKTGYILDGVDVNSKEFMLEYGFVFWHIDTLPSNVQHQFLVASRMPKEWPDFVKIWHGLVKHGMTETFAFAFVTLWNHHNESFDSGSSARYRDFFSRDHVRVTNKNMYDFPLDMFSCDEEYFLNFLNHKMVGTRNKPYAEDPMYKPVNALWGNNLIRISDTNRYAHGLSERYKDISKPKEVLSDFGGPMTVPTWTVDQIIKIGLSEQERLYGILLDRKAA